MPLKRRKQLLKLANHYTIPIIEDDTFGELYFEHRPTTLKSLDTEDLVIYCSSLSKTLHSDIRLGWVAAGRYFDQINYLKYVTTMASPAYCSKVRLDFSTTTVMNAIYAQCGALTANAMNYCRKPSTVAGLMNFLCPILKVVI